MPRKLPAAVFAALLLVAGGVGTAPKAAASGSYYKPWYGDYNKVRFCGTELVDFSNAAQWATPHGCYSRIFSPKQSNYPWRPSFGWCNWVPEEGHTQYSGSTILHKAKHYHAPRTGAVVWFDPREQGAGSAGHWAQLVAIGPSGWLLVEEMNFIWRGAGFAKVDYRFVRNTWHTAYIYP
jgi:hypothetical protein